MAIENRLDNPKAPSLDSAPTSHEAFVEFNSHKGAADYSDLIAKTAQREDEEGTGVWTVIPFTPPTEIRERVEVDLPAQQPQA